MESWHTESSDGAYGLSQLSGVDLDKHSEGAPSNLFAIHCHCQIMSAPDTRGEGDGVSVSISGSY